MIPFKLETRFFKLEFFRRGIVFTIASIIFASGVNLVNGNILLALIAIFNKQVLNDESNEYGFWVGFFLILLSLFLFYLIIINWRIEIYSKTFIQLRKCYDKYGTLINFRMHFVEMDKLKELHEEAYQEYQNTVDFLGENQTYLDIKTHDAARKLNGSIGRKFIENKVYIEALTKLENGIETAYSPTGANEDISNEIEFLKKEFNDFVHLIKEKEKFKIVSKK